MENVKTLRESYELKLRCKKGNLLNVIGVHNNENTEESDGYEKI